MAPARDVARSHTDLLHSGLGAKCAEIGREVSLLENGDRIDTMWGATVRELKSDLRRAIWDVLARLPDYLRDAQRRSEVRSRHLRAFTVQHQGRGVRRANWATKRRAVSTASRASSGEGLSSGPVS